MALLPANFLDDQEPVILGDPQIISSLHDHADSLLYYYSGILGVQLPENRPRENRLYELPISRIPIPYSSDILQPSSMKVPVRSQYADQIWSAHYGPDVSTFGIRSTRELIERIDVCSQFSLLDARDQQGVIETPSKPSYYQLYPIVAYDLMRSSARERNLAYKLLSSLAPIQTTEQIKDVERAYVEWISNSLRKHCITLRRGDHEIDVQEYISETSQSGRSRSVDRINKLADLIFQLNLTNTNLLLQLRDERFALDAIATSDRQTIVGFHALLGSHGLVEALFGKVIHEDDSLTEESS